MQERLYSQSCKDDPRFEHFLARTWCLLRRYQVTLTCSPHKLSIFWLGIVSLEEVILSFSIIVQYSIYIFLCMSIFLFHFRCKLIFIFIFYHQSFNFIALFVSLSRQHVVLHTQSWRCISDVLWHTERRGPLPAGRPSRARLRVSESSVRRYV